MADTARIKANVASMLDQGATAQEVNRYIASEGVTEQDLRGRMSPPDEQAYATLAANPKSTAADLQAFVRQRGFDVTDQEAEAFIANRSKPGAHFVSSVEYRGDPAQPTGTNTLGQNVRAVAGDFLDGILPGASGTIRGTRGVANNAFGALFRGEDFDPSGAFQEAKQEQQVAQDRFNADHPSWASAAGWTGTGVGLLALPEAKLLEGTTLARSAINGALNGLGYGALGGGLNDTGGGRLENAGWGALAGTGLGAAAPVAVGALSHAGATLRRNVPGVDTALSAAGNVARRAVGAAPLPANAAAHAQAERTLNRQLEGATIATGMGTGHTPATPTNIATEVARRQTMGVPAIPADVTEPARTSISRALQGDGTMASRSRAVLMARQAQQGSRVRQHLTDELGPVVDPVAEADAITSRAKAAAGPLYREAYAQPVVVTPGMAEIMRTPAFQDALPQAVRNIRNAGREPTALGFQLDRGGNIAGLETLSTEGFDQVIRAMKDSARTAAGVHPLTGQPVHNTNSVHINSRAKELQGELAAQNPAYADAVGGYADEMAVRGALDHGSKVASLTGPEIGEQLRSMPQHAQEAWTAGARTALANDAVTAALRPATNVAQRTRQAMGLSGAGLPSAAGDASKQQAIETLSGRPGVMSRLDDRLEAEDQAFQTFASVARAAPQLPQDEQALQTAAAALGSAGKAAIGNWKGAAADLLIRGRPQGTMGFQRAYNDRTASLLTASEPANVASAMGALDRRAASDQARRTSRNSAARNAARLGILAATAEPTAPQDDEAVDPWSNGSAGVLYPAYQRGALSGLDRP